MGRRLAEGPERLRRRCELAHHPETAKRIGERKTLSAFELLQQLLELLAEHA